ncbi:hypothetical protein D1872_227590 [compost metagenome]
MLGTLQFMQHLSRGIQYIGKACSGANKPLLLSAQSTANEGSELLGCKCPFLLQKLPL